MPSYSRLLRKATLLAAATAVASVVAFVPVAKAQIFSTGIGNSTTERTAASGPSQRVSVQQTTQVTAFGFWIGVSGAVDLKFMIWDAAGANILYQQVKSVSGLGTGTLVMSNPMAFTLNAGQTYDFAILGNGDYNVSYFFTPTTFSQNGLSLVNNNRNYGSYDTPALQGEASASVALRINGTQTTVPEPTSVALFSVGLTALGIASRRKRRR